MVLIAETYYLRRARMLEFLQGLEAGDDSAAITLYLPAGLSADKIEATLKNYAGRAGLPPELTDIIGQSRNGGVLFWGNKEKLLVSPPFPLKEPSVNNGINAAPLRHLLEVDYTVGLVLVHLGAYAVGLSRGEKLVTSKVGTGLVHGRHKKGGSSQQRFQRRRENQATEFLERVCLHAREQFEPQAKSIDYIVYGGPRQTVMQLRKVCPFLQAFTDRVLPPLDVPDPRQEILEKAVGRVWSSRVTEWREQE